MTKKLEAVGKYLGTPDSNLCVIKHCRGHSHIIYYGRGLCDKHWNELAMKPTDEMKELLDVPIKKPKP